MSKIDQVRVPLIHFSKIHFNIPHLRLCLPRGLLPSGFPTETLYVPLLSPYVPHALPICLDLFTRMISGEEYRA